MPDIRAHLVIAGRVQGVAFRYHTRDQANRLGLTGWVKNLPSGDVEAVFEGLESAVEEMVQWCHAGPPSARVDRVEIRREPAAGRFRRFEIVFH
ncbi:MAG: acylphosphatase [Proteobacteria bacterium]|nr:acylphosphatase [Pseudomonadota bacterium]